MNGTVGFVVPAFNAESTLADTLRSLLNQDDPGWSAAVVDDGSTDATPSITRSFNDPRIMLVRQRNAGLAAARNAGFVQLFTEFVAFLDADDAVAPAYVRSMRGAIGAHDAVCCGTRFVGPGLEDLGWTRSPGSHDLTAQGLLAYNPLPVGSVLLRRAAPQRLRALAGTDNLFDPSLPVHEDWDCWLRLALAGLRVAPPVDDALFSYRLRPGSMSRAIEQMHEEGLGVIARHAHRVGGVVEDADQARLQRDWTLRHIARAIAEDDAPLARRWVERLSPLSIEDLSLIGAALPHAMRRADPCRHDALPEAKARWAEIVRRVLPAQASELLSLARFGADLAPAIETIRREHDTGRSVVLFGMGERGRALASACTDAGVAIDAWIDDHPDASTTLCGSRTNPQHLTARDTLIVTPDAPEAMLPRLRETPARVLLLRDLTAGGIERTEARGLSPRTA